ncbi:MAG: imidazole glycerol phosphate synthase subunit HisH [Methanomicrobiaceae archaeon]|nr:imidazole glycerol phosphate synthase subunit HisH [Methanomicrobiaceae archaeon]
MISEPQKFSVAIVDMGMGNLFSIKQACSYVGLDGFLTSSQEEINNADAIILPGMGAFGDAMDTLESLSLVDVLKKSANSKKPILGICLGMQILMTYGTEFGHRAGLNLIEGHVERFQNPSDGGIPLKVPQNGWNRIDKVPGLSDSWKGTILENLPDGMFMYFNHSYYVTPKLSDGIIATTRYGNYKFCSAFQKGNLIGLQCHPERSGKAGITVYRNFIGIIEQYNRTKNNNRI